ncbi:tripartite tricarboxylate transporter substrate binding protein [Paracraurococcus ruber]|nr:tripartite tricarboxylate transporter substrate binding protein [Paracraurococcus ruber]
MPSRRALLAAALAAAPPAARAQDAAGWPARPVRVVVPYAAGGGTDLTTRAVMDAVGTRLQRPAVVENRPGADGAIGSEAVARAAPDGTTLIGLNPTHLLLRHTAASLPYDPVADFTPVAVFALYAFVLLAAAEAPFRDIPGLIAEARRQPGAIAHGTADVASGVVGARFARAAGITLNEIRYAGGGASTRDLMGGHLTLAWVSTATAMPLLGSDRVRILAVTAARPSPFLPGVPTLAELGLGEANYEGWFGLWGPGRMAPALVERINAEARAAGATEAVQARLRSLAVEPVSLDAAQVAALMREDDARWTRAAAEGLLRRGG